MQSSWWFQPSKEIIVRNGFISSNFQSEKSSNIWSQIHNKPLILSFIFPINSINGNNRAIFTCNLWGGLQHPNYSLPPDKWWFFQADPFRLLGWSNFRGRSTRLALLVATRRHAALAEMQFRIFRDDEWRIFLALVLLLHFYGIIAGKYTRPIDPIGNIPNHLGNNQLE